MGTGSGSTAQPWPGGTSGDPGSQPRASSSEGDPLVGLLMPHLALALLILSLLFADFLLYRRRVRVLQKRAFDKQELMDTFPKRVIAGVYRNIPGSVNATPLHGPISRNTLDPSTVAETTSTAIPAKQQQAADSASVSTKSSAESSDPPGVRTLQKRVSKKKLRLLDSLKSSTVTSPDSVPDSPVTADKPIANGGSSASRRRLEKRESCRKLPPLTVSRDVCCVSSRNGFVQQGDMRLSPLLDDVEREDLSMA